MAQVRGLGPRVGGRLALFCIHRVNRVYGVLVVTSWTCYGALNCRIIIIIIIKMHSIASVIRPQRTKPYLYSVIIVRYQDVATPQPGSPALGGTVAPARGRLAWHGAESERATRRRSTSSQKHQRPRCDDDVDDDDDN